MTGRVFRYLIDNVASSLKLFGLKNMKNVTLKDLLLSELASSDLYQVSLIKRLFNVVVIAFLSEE